MATAVLDVEYLSAYLIVPQTTLTLLVDEPTTELVRSVLAAVAIKAREYNELAADKLRVDIELENVVRSAETRIDGLRASLDKSQKTVEEIRRQLNEEENTRLALESELQKLKSSSTTSTSEAETLRARIAVLESSNRDTVALLECKSTANDRLVEDLQKQHQKGLELGQQLAVLQQSVQNANSAASSAKFREQSLVQELELAKRNNEWLEGELKTKSAEALKYRKDKGARISELQRLNEEANSSIEALRRTEQAVRSRLDEVQKKAEDSFSKIQQLQEAAAQTEEGYRQELESSRRLAELQSQQTETHRSRLKEVEAGLEKAKDEAAEEIGRCQQAIEVERQEREQADHRVSELETEIDRLEGLLSQMQNSGSVPGTPRAGLNGSIIGRSGSPAAFGTPISVRGKSTITATQAIDELYKIKAQLATEKRRSERLAAEMEEMMQGLEAKQPEIEELQAEHERLQQEVVEMSKFVDQVGKDRDRAKRDSRKAESEASTANAEANILRQQLRDLSAQIKMLLYELDAREKGFDALSPSERSHLERVARGEIPEEELDGLTDTDRFISQRLTVFRHVSELQEKNQELLKITRQLGAQMESEEALNAKNQAAKDHEQVQLLERKIENYKDELQSMITRSESYIKERDMFRRMLQHRGQLPPTSDLASVFGQSVDGQQNDILQTTEHSNKDNNNYAVLLRELQVQFDHYREEQTIDRQTLKDQTEKLSIAKVSLQAEIAKTASQLTLANERYEMLHSNYTMLQTENVALQKRTQALSEAAAKQDLRTQQVAEDLVEAKALVESMRNENANLKAEKNLWKGIQERLSKDNEDLMNERNRLNNLISNQQALLNERELSDSEIRRRLQDQVISLESELATTKRKLSDEMEDNKKAQSRKEYDSQQNQKRIDDLANTLSQAREELVATKTTRDHLQSRVEELTIELRSAEEKVELLQPRSTSRPGTNGDSSGGPNGISSLSVDYDREQTLAIEISELKRDIELTKSELDNTKSQMEQYKAISHASEEELRSINATQDQYREEVDAMIEAKNSTIKELQKRLGEISAELANTNNELTQIRKQQADIVRQAEEERAALESEILRLKDEDDKHSTAAKFHQQDLRAQAAIATKAQQDYENELVKHAEATTALQTLRSEYNQLKTESTSLRADAESARVALSQSESSWEERWQQTEQELLELRTIRDNLSAQNRLLHQQLENVGSQISAIQQSRSTVVAGTANGSPLPDTTSDRATNGLLELNTYLRREKEIVEVQYDLKIQESKRLRQQLAYAQTQLDESRLKLDQERRHHADGGRSSTAHKDLMEKLNELNLFRESSITLRNEARQAQSQLAEKMQLVEELMTQIQPLETKIRELEHAKETTDGELHLLQEDRDRWQKRTQDILSKYDRIDPAEMEQLKATLEELRIQRDKLLEEQQPLQEKIQALETEKVAWQANRTKIIDQAKEQNRIQRKKNEERTAERDTAMQENDALQQQITTIQIQLDLALAGKSAAEQTIASLQSEIEATKLEQTRNTSDAVPSGETPLVAARIIPDPAYESQIAELRNELEAIQADKRTLEQQLQDLREQLEAANQERAKAIDDAANARLNHNAIGNGGNLENSHEEGQVEEDGKSGMSDADRQALEDRLVDAEAKAKEAEERAANIESSMEATVKARSEKMKALVNKKLAESKEAQRTELDAEYKLRFEQERRIWLAENQAVAPPGTAPAAQQQSAPAPPETPSTPKDVAPKEPLIDGTNLTDGQVRTLLSTNPTVKSILASNLKKKLEAETQKLKEEQQKFVADVQQKAEQAKAQAVLMESKKSLLRINMSDNKLKVAAAKLDVVEKAAQTTPEKPVGEVWAIAKDAKPPPASAQPAERSTQSDAPSSPAPAPKAALITQQTSDAATSESGVQPSKLPTEPSGVSTATTNGVPTASQTLSGMNNTNRASGIPNLRGAGSMRGRGSSGPHPARGGAPGRGRGGSGLPMPRGGLNPAAENFNAPHQPGFKRPRDEGSIGGQPQGNSGKRIRGDGQGS